MADCHPIFHDRNAMFVAERSSVGIRLRRQLFANYRVPDNTRVYEFHDERIMTGMKFDFYGNSAQETIWGIEIQV